MSTGPEQGRAAASARPTMKNVAAEANVSLKTVSRVVNNEPVSDAKRAAVLAAITKLGFSRNFGAAMLRHGQSASIGLVLEDSSEPFQAALTRAVESVALRHGSLLFVGSYSGEPDRERVLIQALASRRVDGIVVVPSGDSHSYLEPEMRAGVKVVFADRPASGIQADAVLADNVGGARNGVRHLIAQGHRRIAFIGDRPSVFTAHERFTGYRDAVEFAGLPYDSSLVFRHAPDDIAAISHSVADVLSRPQPATAIFSGNALITVSTVRALGARHDIALVGFDDFELADLLTPAVTVVAQDALSIGTNAADLVFKRISGDTTPYVETRIATTLITRGSGEIRP